MTTISITPLIQEAYEVRLQLISPILGMQPSDSVAADWVRARSIERKAHELVKVQGMKAGEAKLEAEKLVNETMDLDMEPVEEAESALKVTVFHRDSIGCHLYDYQIKGFFKEAASRLDLKVRGKTAAAAAGGRFVAGGLWVYPIDRRHDRRIYFLRDGEPITEPDTVEDRIKRIRTPRGVDQTTIAVSEVIQPPAQLRFQVALLKDQRLTRQHVEEMLAYMRFSGLGQWRTGGWGRATAEMVSIRPSEVQA